MSSIPVGIDLGTTYSALAIVDGKGQVQMVSNAEGKHLTPSVVLFEKGNIVVGDVAKDARIDKPDKVVEFIKRSMGTDRRFLYEQKEFSPSEISAMILKKLTMDAKAALGRPFTQAVITCPAYFGADRRDATEKAAQIAGIEVLALINEPTAAALAFGMSEERTGTVLVFDLGGGTFDATVVKFSQGAEIEILASDGDAELGGKDFDDAIIKMVVMEYQRQHGLDISKNMEAIAEVRQKAEKAKHDLTSRDVTTISLNIDGKKLRMELPRSEFCAAIQPLLEGMKFTLRNVLADCELSIDAIDDVILVGGATRVPAVSHMVEEFFGRKPNSTVHPDEAVACGAALFAAKIMATKQTSNLSSEVKKLAKALPEVRDIAPHSIGISVVDQEDKNRLTNSIILPRGTALPASINEQYVTAFDGQNTVKIDVNEGEESDLDYVKELGSFVLSLPTSRPAGSPIDVQVGLDMSGIIRVQATDVLSHQQQQITIDYAVNLNPEQVRERAAWLNRQKVL